MDWLDQTSATLVASDLFETELRRAAVGEGLDQSDAARVLDGVALAALDRACVPQCRVLPHAASAPWTRCTFRPPCDSMPRPSSPTTVASARRQSLQELMWSRPGWRSCPEPDGPIRRNVVEFRFNVRMVRPLVMGMSEVANLLGQHHYAVRLDWGPAGARATAADVSVVVDVLVSRPRSASPSSEGCGSTPTHGRAHEQRPSHGSTTPSSLSAASRRPRRPRSPPLRCRPLVFSSVHRPPAWSCPRPMDQRSRRRWASPGPGWQPGACATQVP